MVSFMLGGVAIGCTSLGSMGEQIVCINGYSTSSLTQLNALLYDYNCEKIVSSQHSVGLTVLTE